MSLSSDTSEPSETDDDEPIMDKQKRRKERTEAKHEVRQTKGGRTDQNEPPHKQQKQHSSTQKKTKYKDSVTREQPNERKSGNSKLKNKTCRFILCSKISFSTLQQEDEQQQRFNPFQPLFQDQQCADPIKFCYQRDRFGRNTFAQYRSQI
jgi:hypothetical protein